MEKWADMKEMPGEVFLAQQTDDNTEQGVEIGKKIGGLCQRSWGKGYQRLDGAKDCEDDIISSALWLQETLVGDD